MPDRLLRKTDIAAMLGTTPGVAAAILSERGCHPIDFGYGRGRGQRWLESAVVAVLKAMHTEAQPAPPKDKRRKSKIPAVDLANMKTSEVQALLTRATALQ